MGFAQNREEKMIVPFQKSFFQPLIIEEGWDPHSNGTEKIRTKKWAATMRELDRAVNDWVKDDYRFIQSIDYHHLVMNDDSVVVVIAGKFDDKDLDGDPDLPEDE